MAVVLRNASVPGLAVTYEGIGTPLDMQPVTGANTRKVGLTFSSKTYFKHIACSGT